MNTPDKTAQLAPVNQPAELSLMEIVTQASRMGATPDQLATLLKVKHDFEAGEAKKAFNRAVSEFQARCPIIPKEDKAYDKKYARLDRIWRTIKPIMSDLGLSIAWQVNKPAADGYWQLEGQLRHRDGHAQDLSFYVPIPELIKGQNKAQQGGSASTYAQRYGTCAALNIVTGDDDDDGNAAGTPRVSKDKAKHIQGLLDRCRQIPNFNEDGFWQLMECSLPDEVALERYGQAVYMLESKLRAAEKAKAGA